MGYAIFTARKLMLTNRINQMNFRIMQLSQQQQTLADNAAKLQTAIANTKNLFSSIGNAIMMSNSTLSNGIQQAITSNLTNGQKFDEASMNNIFQLNQLMNNNPALQLLNIANQTIQMQSDAQLKQVKEQENLIELERKTLETQVKAMTAELQEVEKAEDKQIQNSAPKFA